MTARIGVCLCAYNEERFIVPAIRQWRPFADRILVLVSEKPWNGEREEPDQTADFAMQEGAEVALGEWRTEAEQRNFGLEVLKDCSHVVITDPDEFFTLEDRVKLLARLKDPADKMNASKEPIACFRVARMVTYWKDLDHVLYPADRHKPIIAVDPAQVRFTDKRDVATDYRPTIDVTVHHLSWARTDEEVRLKIRTYSHAPEFKRDWYEKKWLANAMEDVRPYGVEQSDVVYHPAPDEIKALFPIGSGV